MASLPSSHFRPGDYPLLRSYCESESLHWEATRAIAEEGAVIQCFNITINRETGEEKAILRTTKANPWVAIQTQTACTMAQLATKLRLCANSRLSNSKAAFEKEEKPKSIRKGLMFGEV